MSSGTPSRRAALHDAGQSQSLLEAALESTTDGILVVDLGGRILSYNLRFAEMWRLSPDVVETRDDDRAIASVLEQLEDPEAFLEKVRELYASPEAESVDVLTFRDGRVFERFSRPHLREGRPAGRVWSFRDVTERRRSERLQQATYRISESAHEAASLDELFRALHGIVSELMPARNFYIALHDGASDTISFPYFVDEYDARPSSKSPGRGLTEYVLRTGQPTLASPEVLANLVSRGEVDLIGAPSIDWLGAPLRTSRQTIGVVVVQSYTEGVRFRDTDRDLLAFVSTQLAMAIERKGAEAALRESERRYRLLFERGLAGAYRMTADGRVVECNQALANLLGYSAPAEVAGLGSADLFVNLAERQSALDRLRAQRTAINQEARMRRKDGTFIWVLLNESLFEEGGAPLIVDGSLIDITDRKLAEERTWHLANHDALTGLPNRVLFKDRLSLAILHAGRRRHSLAVMFLDLDQFKRVNDTLGHSAGDELLVEAAARLKRCIRSDDTVARVGGDEFLLLLNEISRETDAAGMARKILGVLAAPFLIQKRELFIEASIGIGLYPGDGEDAETLVRNVDTAMYRAKETGRNSYQFFTRKMQEQSQERAALENGLRPALPRSEFVLHYQPILRLATRTPFGVEALVRWRHPEKGLLPPLAFIPLAEEVGLIGRVGEWVLRQACAQGVAWRARGADLRMSVNVSARQFQHRDFASIVRRIVEESGLPASLLELEITESIAMKDVAHTGRVLAELSAFGVQISMDDFGTGHSSLNYLKHFPIRRLKIDQSFVAGMTHDEKDKAIVATIISIAGNLGLDVTAEGVETEAQAALLGALGCADVQGFLFCRPVPAEELDGVLSLPKEPKR